MVHVRPPGVGVVGEGQQQLVVPVRFGVHRVLAAGQLRRRGCAVDGMHLELHVVHMEVVREQVQVPHGPQLGAAHLHGLVDACHVHPRPVDLAALQLEPAPDAHRAGVQAERGQLLGDLGRGGELLGSDQGEHVERIIGADRERCRHLTQVRCEGVQPHVLARLESHEHLGSLTRGEAYLGDLERSTQQSAVRGDEHHLLLRQPERVGAGRGRVQDPQPHQPGGHLQPRPGHPVHGHHITEETHLVAAVVDHQLASLVERLVRDHHRHVVHPVGVRQLLLDRRRLRPGRRDQLEHPCQAAVDVALGGAVRVRVVPERARRLLHHPLRPPGVTRFDHLVRTAVHLRRQVHPVPVRGGGLR